MHKTPAWIQYPEFNWDTKHAVIIGGGIAGAQMAYHLCQNNWQVTLIERHKKLATEASGNPAGVISPKITALPSDGEDFYSQSFHYTIAQLETLANQGRKIEWDACGALQLVHNPREEKRWLSLKNRNLSTDFIQLLDEAETQSIAGIKLHPNHGYKSFYFPKGAWVNPKSFVKVLCDHPNCTVVYQHEAIRLEKNGINWNVRDKNNVSIAQAEVIIIANGKDLFNFEQSNYLPHLPVAGQTTLAKASPFSTKLKTVIGHEGYLTPALGDTATTNLHHTFGATFDRGINNPTLITESDNLNIEQLSQYLPEFIASLKNIKSAHVAVRMTTPDRFPYVGGLPDKNYYLHTYNDLHQGKQWKEYPQAKYQQGLFMLGGLGSRGFTTSGFCAKILSDLLQNKLESENSQILLRNCHPARFIIKNLKRNLRD